MAEPIPVPLGTSSADGRVPAEGGARLINCYADRTGNEGRIQYPIYAVDGLELFSTLSGTGIGAIRSGFAFSPSALYVATGTKIAKVTQNGSFTLIGGTIAASGFVTMARNRKEPNAQIAISVASTTGNLYFLSEDTLTEFDLDDLESGGTLVGVTALDGYFILLFSNSEFFITAIDDDTIDPLDFAKAESNPDGGVAIAVLGPQLIVFGEKSTEFWSNQGDVDFPFVRNMTRSFGCYAAGTVKNLVQVLGGSEIADTLVFAATDSDGAYIGICLMQGTSPSKISTQQIDRAVMAESSPASLRSQTWSNGERSFYALHTTAGTFIYDFSTGFWHERRSSSLAFWRAQTSFAFGTKVIVGDYNAGLLYQLKPGLYNASTPSTLTLKHSNDGGQSWVTRTPKTIGGSSEQIQRLRINRIGRGKHQGKAFELSITEAVMENGTGLSMSVRTPIAHAWPLKAQMAAAHIDIVPGVSQTSRVKGILGFALQSDLVTEQAH